MHTPTPERLLKVWERGFDRSATARGLLLLGSGCPDRDAEALAALPLGRRDALLLQLRARLFGVVMNVVTSCPQCAAAVEAEFDCDDLLLAAPAADAATPPLEHVAHGIRVRFRLPDSNDLMALESRADAVDARQLLLARCVLCAQREGEAESGCALPDELQAELAESMARADPQADLQLAFRCPDCGHAWQPLFDIARFVWQELHAWALHMLRDVDTLAAAYHWSEADILALGPRRRQAYLELCLP